MIEDKCYETSHQATRPCIIEVSTRDIRHHEPASTPPRRAIVLAIGLHPFNDGRRLANPAVVVLSTDSVTLLPLATVVTAGLHSNI